MLKTSARNSRLVDSCSLIFRNSVMSKFRRLGLFITLRPALPKVSPRGAANAEAFPNAGPKLFELTAPIGVAPWMLPTMSGYEATELIPPATPALSGRPIPSAPKPALTTVYGVPLCTVVTPEISHPPNMDSTNLSKKPGELGASDGSRSFAQSPILLESTLNFGSVQT